MVRKSLKTNITLLMLLAGVHTQYNASVKPHKKRGSKGQLTQENSFNCKPLQSSHSSLRVTHAIRQEGVWWRTAKKVAFSSRFAAQFRARSFAGAKRQGGGRGVLGHRFFHGVKHIYLYIIVGVRCNIIRYTIKIYQLNQCQTETNDARYL